MTSLSVAAFLLASSASAINLFATSYNDHSLNVLSLDGSNLSVKQKSYDCGSEPTWLTYDESYSVLYCLNEGWGGSASITTYETALNGSIKTRKVIPTLKSPVASTTIGNNLAIAYFDTSSVQIYRNPGSYAKEDHYSLEIRDSFTYNQSQPGPVPDRQQAPHPHQAIFSNGDFPHLFVPDLGSDLIRIYYLGSGSGNVLGNVETLKPFPAVPGSGPRHGVFVKQAKNSRSFFYTVNELDNTITGYRHDYSKSIEFRTPNLTQLFHHSIHGPGGSVPAGTKASEIALSPDNKFLIVSSRGENSLTIPNFDPSNSTALPSDPLITYAIDQDTGFLKLVQTAPAGGRNPRGFSLNLAGTLVASALQDDNRVVVFERNVTTGLIGKVVAHATVGEGQGNGPNYVIFQEKTYTG